LYESSDYIIVNKPPDVRMNGDFDVTVEKLVQHHRPALKDVEQKWAHRLDYATSGVLCVGLTKEGTSKAARCFEDKTAKKVYLAVVEGIVDWSKVRTRTRAEVDAIDAKGSKKRKKGGGGVQYKNASSFFQERQGVLKRRVAEGCNLSEEEAILLETPWKIIKRAKVEVESNPSSLVQERSICEALAEEARVKAVEAAAAEMSKIEDTSEGLGIWRWADGEEAIGEKVILDYPVAEITGDFKMQCGNAQNPGRASRTVASILGVGRYQG